jgi:Flp pilus assembly protein TadD
MGGVLFFGDGDAAAAEREFTRAIELNPNYPIAHQWLAILLAERRRDDEARRHAEIAVRLDPMEATFHQAAGLVHYYGGRYGDAVTSERRALEIRPLLPFARVMLIKAQIMSGDAAAAVRSCDDVKAAASTNVELAVSCGIALQRAGDARATALRKRLEAMKPYPASALLQWHAATGGLARAFELIGPLRASNDVPPNLAFDPLFEPLRSDPRFASYSSSANR